MIYPKRKSKPTTQVTEKLSSWVSPTLKATMILSCCAAPLSADEESSKVLNKVGVIGCMKPKKSPAFLNYSQRLKPDLMLWVGDNVYADARTPKALQGHYDKLKNKEGFKEVRMIETMATWDDHDYGLNNSGAENPIKNESKEIFSSFWGLPKHVKEREGIYHSRIYGKGEKSVQVIMLDCRFSKTSKTMLSKEQWDWLGEQLEKKATFRLIVSGQQVLIPKSTRFEAWTKIGNEQQRLFDLIKKKKAEGVIFVTGDQHYAETLKYPKALGYDAWEFMFGGVNQEESACKAAAVYRVDKAHSPNKSASIVFDWGADPSVSFQIHNEKWERILNRTVKRSQLKSN